MNPPAPGGNQQSEHGWPLFLRTFHPGLPTVVAQEAISSLERTQLGMMYAGWQLRSWPSGETKETPLLHPAQLFLGPLLGKCAEAITHDSAGSRKGCRQRRVFVCAGCQQVNKGTHKRICKRCNAYNPKDLATAAAAPVLTTPSRTPVLVTPATTPVLTALSTTPVLATPALKPVLATSAITLNNVPAAAAKPTATVASDVPAAAAKSTATVASDVPATAAKPTAVVASDAPAAAAKPTTAVTSDVPAVTAKHTTASSTAGVPTTNTTPGVPSGVKSARVIAQGIPSLQPPVHIPIADVGTGSLNRPEPGRRTSQERNNSHRLTERQHNYNSSASTTQGNGGSRHVRNATSSSGSAIVQNNKRTATRARTTTPLKTVAEEPTGNPITKILQRTHNATDAGGRGITPNKEVTREAKVVTIIAPGVDIAKLKARSNVTREENATKLGKVLPQVLFEIVMDYVYGGPELAGLLLQNVPVESFFDQLGSVTIAHAFRAAKQGLLGLETRRNRCIAVMAFPDSMWTLLQADKRRLLGLMKIVITDKLENKLKMKNFDLRRYLGELQQKENGAEGTNHYVGWSNVTWTTEGKLQINADKPKAGTETTVEEPKSKKEHKPVGPTPGDVWRSMTRAERLAADSLTKEAHNEYKVPAKLELIFDICAICVQPVCKFAREPCTALCGHNTHWACFYEAVSFEGNTNRRLCPVCKICLCCGMNLVGDPRSTLIRCYCPEDIMELGNEFERDSIRRRTSTSHSNEEVPKPVAHRSQLRPPRTTQTEEQKWTRVPNRKSRR